MSAHGSSSWLLAREAEALLTRLEHVQPFSLTMPHIASAAPSAVAWHRIERHLIRQRVRLRQRVLAYVRWLASDTGRRAAAHDQRRRFTALRLGFDAALAQIDIFADVVGQRSEHETGVWLAGLDVVATDALRLSHRFFDPPPLVTYLDRGHGAAIRRVSTRLPGGSKNPVAVVRIPRERMLGSGVGASLVHEVGHQGAALLRLDDSLRDALRRRRDRAVADRPAWRRWERWIGEIVADYWAVGKLGVAATSGLLGVLSLPHATVLHMHSSGVHPLPWIRARLSCAMGWALYPDPQWQCISTLWGEQYPTDALTTKERRLLALLEQTIPELVEHLVEHRPPSLWGMSLRDVMPASSRQPGALRSAWTAWQADPRRMCAAAPTHVLAALGQARWDGSITSAQESAVLGRMLRHWALRRAMPPAATPTTCGRCSISNHAA